MTNALWIGPLVAGLAFGLLFGFGFPLLLAWLVKVPSPGVPAGVALSTKARAMTGLASGVLFGTLMYIEKLVDVGAAGQGWAWLLTGTKWFGTVCILGGILVLGARLRAKA